MKNWYPPSGSLGKTKTDSGSPTSHLKIRQLNGRAAEIENSKGEFAPRPCSLRFTIERRKGLRKRIGSAAISDPSDRMGRSLSNSRSRDFRSIPNPACCFRSGGQRFDFKPRFPPPPPTAYTPWRPSGLHLSSPQMRTRVTDGRFPSETRLLHQRPRLGAVTRHFRRPPPGSQTRGWFQCSPLHPPVFPGLAGYGCPRSGCRWSFHNPRHH